MDFSLHAICDLNGSCMCYQSRHTSLFHITHTHMYEMRDFWYNALPDCEIKNNTLFKEFG